MARLRRWLAVAVLTPALLLPCAGRADSLDDILAFLVAAGVVDGAIVDAKPLIECLVANGSPTSCIDIQKVASTEAANLEQDATSEAEKAAAQFVPSDPAVKTVVEIVKATMISDWLRVLELTGIDLLSQIACKTGLSWGGPAKEFICGQWAPEVLSLAEPVVHELLSIIKSWPNIDLWKLVSTVGLDFGCKIAPEIPLKDEVCGVLGAAVQAIASLGQAALDALGAGAEALSDLLNGGGSGQSIELYYDNAVRPLMYKRALERLTVNRQNLGLDPPELQACIQKYVSAASCAILSDKLSKESAAMAMLAADLPEGYAQAWLVDETKRYAFERPGMAGSYQNFLATLGPSQWDTLVDSTSATTISAFLPQGDVAYLDAQFKACRGRVSAELMGTQGYATPAFSGVQPSKLSSWVCYHAVGERLAVLLAAETQRLDGELTPALAAVGCARDAGYPAAFTCANHVGFGACIAQSFQDFGENRYCRVDREPAAAHLGESLVGVLGAERCLYVPYTKGSFGDWDPRVQCTRPWKDETCETLLSVFLAKHGALYNRIEMDCRYLAAPEFEAAVVEAGTLLDTLNGVDPNAPPPGISGASQSIFSQGKPCRQTFDPLALTCATPAPLAKLASPLPVCAPDPNRNGADAPCYDGPLTEGTPGPSSTTAVPQLPAQPSTGERTTAVEGGASAPMRAVPTGEIAGRPTAPLGRPAQVLVEAEQLVGRGASADGGRIDVQAMQGFGTQWSGNAQLFWSGAAVGSTLELAVDVVEAGAYAVVLRMTQASDYADVRFEVDGQASFISFAGYAPRVAAADAPIGTYTLRPGTHTIRITIGGKQDQSSNYFVGVDRVTLTMLTRSQ